MNRIEVRSSVLSCRNCELANVGSGPIPWSGPNPARVAIIGEAPGRQEDEGREPFIGPAGIKLRQWLHTAGIDEREVAFLNTVSCYPAGTPTRKHIEACHSNLINQLKLVDPQLCLVLGSTALSAWWPGEKISDIRGQWLELENGDWKCWAMVTFHPAYVLRSFWEENKVLMDLKIFKEVLEKKWEVYKVEEDF